MMGRLHLFVGLFAVFFWGSVTNFIQSPKYYAGLSVEYDAGRVEMLSHKSFFGFNETNGGRPLCSQEQIKVGSWVPITMQRPPYVSRNEHLRCYPEKQYITGDWQTYEWYPSSDCELIRWNREQFCSLMQRVTILVIGDSLSWEQYSSLAQLLGARVKQDLQHESKLRQENVILYGCGVKVRLVFRRDDILSNITGAINDAFPEVLVFNRGAHYVNDSRLISGIQTNIEEVKNWKSRCKAMGIRCHAFWRTSVPGHPNCDRINFSEPVNNLEAMEAWISNRSNYNNRTIKYHWYDYQHQNELVVSLLQQELKDDFDVLDAYYLNILRPDEHRAHQGDCLHSCYPGKMDVYNRLLLHFLYMRRTWEDVYQLKNVFEKAKFHLQSGGP